MDALATAGELDIHLQREIDEDRAGLALQLASGAVRAYCGWDLSLQTTTLQVDGTGTILLTLPTLCLGAVTEIRVDTLPLDLATVIPARKGQILRRSGWPRGALVEVDCDHGYDPIPDLIKLVVLEQAAKSLTNPEGLTSATTGRVTRTWAGTGTQPRLSALDERLLDRYRI